MPTTSLTRSRPEANEKLDVEARSHVDVTPRHSTDRSSQEHREKDGVTVEGQDDSDLAAEQGGLGEVRSLGVRVADDDSSDDRTRDDGDVNHGCCCLRHSVVALLNGCSGHELENGKPGACIHLPIAGSGA